MKAEILICEIYEGAVAFVHGQSYYINRILVSQANNLVITLHGDDLYVWDDFKRDDSCKTVKNIDLPDDFVQKAISFMKGKVELMVGVKTYLK